MEGPLQDMLERIDKKIDDLNARLDNLLKPRMATETPNRWAAFSNDDLQKLNNNLDWCPLETELWAELRSRYAIQENTTPTVTTTLAAVVTNVIENNKFIVTGYFLGHIPNLGFLVGQVMKQAKDFATPAEAQAELHRQLDKY